MSYPSQSTVVILASARSYGATRVAAECAMNQVPGARMIDVGALQIEPYVYGGTLRRDDFGILVDALTSHGQIVFASPVYWYAMSGSMKNVLDRLTDLLTPSEKHMGRALAGRRMYALATGTDDLPPAGYDVPFARTAAYFAMSWGGLCYVRSEGTQLIDGEARKIEAFTAKLSATPTT